MPKQSKSVCDICEEEDFMFQHPCPDGKGEVLQVYCNIAGDVPNEKIGKFRKEGDPDNVYALREYVCTYWRLRMIKPDGSHR